MKNEILRLISTLMLTSLKLLVILISLTLVVSSCSGEKKKDDEKKKVNYEIETKGGLTVVKNKNIPNNPDFKLTLTQIDSIPFADKEETIERSFKRPTAMCSDDVGNIYIADFTTSKIFKFNKDFKFLFSFGGKGTGPGEFAGGPVTLSYGNDKISASCIQRENIIVYNTKGEFVKNFPQNIRSSFSHGQLGFNDNVIMNCVGREFDGEEAAIISSVYKINSELSEQEMNLYTSKTKSESKVIPIRNMHVRFAAGNDMLYIGEVSEDNYKIQGFNSEFKNVLNFSKSYRSRVVKNTEAQVYMFMPNSLGGSFFPKSQTTWKNRKLHYKSISYMMVDKNERLWVVSPEENNIDESGVYLDIFEKGIYLNTVFLDFFKEKSTTGVWVGLHLIDDKLFYIDMESEYIRVYDYK